VIGWVGFNILQPAFNQLNRQNEIREEAVAATGKSSGRKKRGVAGAVGLGAALSMFAAQNADAATELSQLAASDNRCVFEQGCCWGRVSRLVWCAHKAVRCHHADWPHILANINRRTASRCSGCRKLLNCIPT
jgi:hypothetical protein